ncbi:hypothetical protein SAMN05421754_10832 [Nitrosomonas sp. Nm58]|nr:hypothetical protein SAMN05421754_10832 [Nitrosomonas sp. Nm58]
MNREVHVRFCEHLKGKFLRVTRPVADAPPFGTVRQRAYKIMPKDALRTPINA